MKLKEIYSNEGWPTIYTASCIDQQAPGTFTRLVSYPSAMVKPSVADACGLTQVEMYTREYIHEIHKKRVAKLKHFNQIEILTECNNITNVNSTAVNKYTSLNIKGFSLSSYLKEPSRSNGGGPTNQRTNSKR